MARRDRNTADDAATDAQQLNDNTADAATEHADHTDPAPPEEKKTRTRRPRAAKGEQLTPDDITKLSEFVAKELKDARANADIGDDELAELFLLNKKLKTMTGGGGNASAT